MQLARPLPAKLAGNRWTGICETRLGPNRSARGALFRFNQDAVFRLISLACLLNEGTCDVFGADAGGDEHPDQARAARAGFLPDQVGIAGTRQMTLEALAHGAARSPANGGGVPYHSDRSGQCRAARHQRSFVVAAGDQPAPPVYGVVALVTSPRWPSGLLLGCAFFIMGNLLSPYVGIPGPILKIVGAALLKVAKLIPCPDGTRRLPDVQIHVRQPDVRHPVRPRHAVPPRTAWA